MYILVRTVQCYLKAVVHSVCFMLNNTIILTVHSRDLIVIIAYATTIDSWNLGESTRWPYLLEQQCWC